MRTTTFAAALALLLLCALPGPLPAAGNDEGPKRDPLYVKARALLDEARYAEAVPLLQELVAKDPKDADAFNLLGFGVRKMGRPQEALGYYQMALTLRPKHRAAHEYIGEAYLMLGQPDKAREHLAFLDEDCWLPCKEYSELRDSIARYEATQKR